MENETIGAVLAGGRSARMGKPKALVGLAGAPLISYPLAAVAAAELEAVVVAKPDSRLPELNCRILTEPPEPVHPLLGVLTALRELEAGAVIVVPCDTPFVSAALVRALAEADAPLVVCEAGGRLHPLLGRYEQSLAEELEGAVERGDSARRTARALGARVLGEAELSNFGNPERLLFNVNDSSDLAQAERLLTGSQ